MTINRVCLAGNLTRDAELRQTAGGTSVLNVGLAVNNRRKNSQTGEWEDEPCFVDCTMFGQRAEKLSQYLAKGTKVAVDGRLRYSSWERDGQKRSKLEVIVDDIEFMGGRGDGQQQARGTVSPQVAYAAEQARNATRASNGKPAFQEVPQGSMYDADIPF